MLGKGGKVICAAEVYDDLLRQVGQTHAAHSGLGSTEHRYLRQNRVSPGAGVDAERILIEANSGRAGRKVRPTADGDRAHQPGQGPCGQVIKFM